MSPHLAITCLCDKFDMVTHQHWFCQIHFETLTYNTNLTHAVSGRSCTSQTHFPKTGGCPLLDPEISGSSYHPILSWQGSLRLPKAAGLIHSPAESLSIQSLVESTHWMQHTSISTNTHKYQSSSSPGSTKCPVLWFSSETCTPPQTKPLGMTRCTSLAWLPWLPQAR